MIISPHFTSPHLMWHHFTWPHLTWLDLTPPHSPHPTWRDLTWPHLTWPHLISCDITSLDLTWPDLMWPHLTCKLWYKYFTFPHRRSRPSYITWPHLSHVRSALISFPAHYLEPGTGCHLTWPDLASSHLTLPHLTSSYLTSPHLTLPYLTSNHSAISPPWHPLHEAAMCITVSSGWYFVDRALQAIQKERRYLITTF